LGGYIIEPEDGPQFLAINSLSETVYPFLDPFPPLPTSAPPAWILDDYPDVFSKSNAERLPPHRPFDCRVDLLPGHVPPTSKIYQLTLPEQAAMDEWVSSNLQKGFIQPSTSPYGAPCFFVKKKDGSLRMCVDYRRLNAVTVKDRNPIPLISDLIRSLAKGNIFTALDLRGAYNLLRMRPGDEPKTAFLTKQGQFEFKVMPFGLTNAPPQFQTMMTALFKGKSFVLVYLDDIVVFSEDPADHSAHVRTVLDILRANNLYCKLEKCQFGVPEIHYLGYVISTQGLRMDPAKVQSIVSWPPPQNLKELQIFLGFTNFYRRLLRNYAQLTNPLTALLRQDTPFDLPITCFNEIKSAFQSAALLLHPDETKPFVIETDASNIGLGGVLSQYDEEQALRPVAFYSRQLKPEERNYAIYDKELLAIIACFEQWRHFLLGARHPSTVLCDHANLVYFTTNQKLSARQARWSLFLNEFDFTITHRPGARSAKPDHLSRRPDYAFPHQPDNGSRLLDPAIILTDPPLQVNATASYEVLHRRLGHIGDAMLRKTLPAVDGLALSGSRPTKLCEPCELGKARHRAIPTTSRSTPKLLEVIQSDTQGPFPLPALDGTRGNIKFIDTASGYVKMEPIANLSSRTALDCFKRYQARMERRTNQKIKYVRTDQGREYKKHFLHYLADQGITKQSGIAYEHHHPGKCERAHQTIMTLGRAMLIASKLPINLYCEAQMTATYLYNRTVHGEDTITPYQHIYGKRPDLSHLRPFGSVCYAHILPNDPQRNKLSDAAVKCRLIGYLDDDDTEERPGYKLLREDTLTIIHCKSVRFDESAPMTPLNSDPLDIDDTLFSDPNFTTSDDQSDSDGDHDDPYDDDTSSETSDYFTDTELSSDRPHYAPSLIDPRNIIGTPSAPRSTRGRRA